MAEFNPYKLEEEKWTPKNVYEILPPNAVSWSDYDFGQGTDNVDGEAAKKSFIDGFVDFFKDLFGVAGQILGGAIELGGKILGGFVDGVINLVGGIAKAIGSIFGGGSSESPNLPLFNPIKTNLEAAIQPHRDKINESWQRTEEILAEQEVLRGQMADSLDEMRDASSRAQEASERAGTAIEEAEAALAAAEDARETLEEYNTALTEQIRVEFNSAVGRADTAVEKAETLAGELADFKAQHQLEIDDAIGKAEQAVADLATLSPQVKDAVDKSEAATDKVAALTPQVSEAVDKAGEAVDKAGQTLEEYTAWSKAQKTRIDTAVSKAEAATANVTALTPQVADAVAQSAAATDNVATLTPKVTDAVTQAGSAVAKADAVTSAYNTFKTEQQARIDSAVSKAEKATSDVSTLTPKVTDAVSKSNKAAADVSTLTPKVDDAAAKAAKASTDVSALTPKVTAAQDKANKAANDLSTLTPKVTAAQTRADAAYTEAGKVRSEVTPKIEAAQTKGESALAVADKAVDWLRNPNEIGASLIAIDPETKKPNWAEHLDPVTAEENPLNLPNAYKTGATYSRNPRRMPVNVDPSTEYMVSLWVKADKPGSDMTYDIRNQAGELAFNARRKVDGFLDAGDNWRAYWIKNVPTEWTQYKKIVTPRETTRTAEFGLTYFKHSGGDTQDVIQYVADFQIYPLVPSQLDVDQAQNDAIRANQDILRQQDEINEAQRVANLAQKNFNDNQIKWNTASTNATKALADAAKAQEDINAEQAKFNTFQTQFNKDQTKWNAAVDRSIATQKTVNDNFNKWTDGAAKAIEANTTAIKALTKPEIGSSLIALDADTREPHYLQWAGTPATPSTAGLPFTKAVRVTSSTQDRRDAPADMRVPVKVNPDITYKWSMWVYSNKIGTEIAFLTTSDSIGLCVEKTTYERDDSSNTSKWGIFLKDIPMGWSKQEGTIKFLPGTDNVRLYSVEWNKTEVASAQQWFGAFDIVPDVPTQAQVDDAQNKAIESLNILSAKQDDWNKGTTAALEAQKKVNDNFSKWTTGATTAIEANTTAIKALSKIDIGESLIAYLTPTDAEVKAGTAKYDVPVWTTGAHREYDGNNLPPAHVKYAFGASSTEGTKAARSALVAVRPGTKYILSFWAYGSGDLVVYMLGNGEGNPVRSTRQLMVDQNTLEVLKDAGGRRRYDPANNGNSSNANGTQWLLNGFKPDQLYKWVHYKFEVEFTESTTEVRFQNFYWNWKTTSVYGQYLAGMQFYPDVPTQASVDDAQNKAIESLNILSAKQDDWNEGTQAALDAQETVNKNFQKWTEGATTAIEANTKALAILSSPQGASSIIPTDPLTKEPYYIGWAGDRISVTNIDSVPTRIATKYTGTARKRVYASAEQLVPVKVARGQVYRWVAWTYSNVANSEVILYFRDPATGTGTKSTTHDEESKTFGHTNYGLFLRGIPSGWNKVSGTITFQDEISSLELYSIGWNQSNLSSSVTQYLTGFDIAPDVPTQESVDAAQNEAIAANTEALKALGKKALGASLVPYKTPTTQEVKDYAAGDLDYDPWADPEYFDAGYSVAANTTYGRYTRATSSQKTKSFLGTLVSVDSSIEYKVKFDAYASVDGSILVVAMQDQNGSTAVQSTSVRDAGTMGNTGYPIHYLTLKKGWSSYSGKIRFKPTTTAARFSTFYWNHTNGTSGTQGLANLEIVPDIPDANVVNELQDNAIRKNTAVGSENKKAIDALRDGLDAAIELVEVDQMIEDLRGALGEEERKRSELQEEVDALQTEMIPRTIVWDSSRETFDDYISIPTSSKVVALPNWTGQIVVTSVIRRGRGTSSEPTYYQTSINRYSVPDGTSREWTIYSGASYEYISSMRVDYWVYRGKPRTLILKNAGPYITGSSFKSGTWSVIDYRTVGKTYGTGRIEWRADLRYADRGVTYRFKIQVNGTDIKTYEWKNIGPLTGLGSGKKTLRFEHEFNLPDDATVRILGYAGSSTAKQAQVSLLQGTLSYVQDTAREAK